MMYETILNYYYGIVTVIIGRIKNSGYFQENDMQTSPMTPYPAVAWRIFHPKLYLLQRNAGIRHFDMHKLYSSKVIKFVMIKTNLKKRQTKQRDKQTKICFDQYELDYLGRIKFLQVKMPYTAT